MRKSGSQQDLHAIRYNALNGTRERVQDACCLAWVNAKFLAYLLGYVSYCKYCDRIVSRAKIDKTNKSGN